MIYRREIDGLRAVAVVLVILFHADFSWMPGGYIGVDVFFVISGYLITTLILGDLENGTFALSRFYERRIRRIFPALAVVLIFCLPLAYRLMLPDELLDFSNSLRAVLVFLSNFHFLNEVGYFSQLSEKQPLLHTWSLAVEEQYYLFFPLLVMLLWRGGRWLLVAATAAVALGSFSYAEAQSWVQSDTLFFNTLARVWELLVGSLLAVFLLRRGAPVFKPSVAELGGAIGLAAILVASLVMDRHTPFPGRYALLPTVGTACIILFASPATSIGRLLSSRWMVGVGLISYSLYLWHQPLFAFARLADPASPSDEKKVMLIISTFILAALTWRLVEQPFRNRQFTSRRSVAAFSLVSMLCLASASAGGYFLEGIPSRFSGSDKDLLVSWSDRTRYVVGDFETASKKGGYEDLEKLNVLIIGDSFAQDFFNILREGELLPNAEIRVRYIPAPCQIYRGDIDVREFIAKDEWRLCDKDYFGDLDVTIADSDLVFLVASWREWAALHIVETIDRLQFPGTARVVVVGRKNFGDFQRSAYIHMSEQEKSAIRKKPDLQHLKVNEIMKRESDRMNFVDLHGLVCGDDSPSCPLFTETGRLISYDGHHLTREGAAFIGGMLHEHPEFGALRGEPEDHYVRQRRSSELAGSLLR